MRARTIGLSLLLVLTTLTAVAGSSLPVTAALPRVSAVSAVRAAPCADVLLVGAAGSGEGSTRSLPFGRTLQTFRKGFLADAATVGRTVQTRYAGIASASVGVLQARGSRTTPVTRAVTAASVRAWEGDLGTRVTTILRALADQALACPHQQIVLTGYAQGAMAMHRVLLRLPNYPGIFRRVVGAALVADGDRVRGTRATLSGSPMAPRLATGVQQWARTAAADVPASGWTVPVWSTCTRTDLVCHVTSTPFATAVAAHRGYTSGPAASPLRAVADRVFARSMRWATPARVAPVVAAQDVAFSYRIPVVVAGADLPRVVFAGASNLPPGLTLDATGLLSGTPTTAGVYNVGYTVTNTVSPIFDRPVPGAIQIRVLNQAPRTVSAGGEHTCSVRFDGSLWCWGRNTWGAVGNGLQGPGTPDPTQVGTDSDWATVAAGGGHTCAAKTNGTLWCWGVGHKGQLGDGDTEIRTSPVRVGTGTAWAQLSAGWFHTCGLRTNRTLACWGENSSGQIGDGTMTTRLRPLSLPGTDWASISAGGWNTCGIRTDHSLWCWGRNDFGQVGDGSTSRRVSPTKIGDNTWSQVSVGWAHTCAVKTSGQLRCWGRGDRGQLGDAGFVQRLTPVQPAGDLAATAVAVGDTHSCAIGTDGTTWCWGSNDYGQLNDGTGDQRGVPTLAAGSFSSLSAGWMHSCAISLLGPLACWGNNERGQFGDGTNTDTRAPRSVAPPGEPVNGKTHFTLASFNVLGDIHTLPYRDADFRAPSRIRSEWEADALAGLGLPDVIGAQEMTRPQHEALVRATGGVYAAFPGPVNNYKAVMTSIYWLRSRWTLVAKETFQVPFMNWPKPRPAVRLRNLATGQEIWVINTHHAPQDMQAERNEAMKVIIAKVKEKAADGIPVFLTGDFNEGRTALCKVLGQTSLYSPRGGTYANGTCSPPPGHLRVDWIFGSKRIGTGPGVLFDAYHEWRTTLIGRGSDHHLLMTGVTLP